MDIKLKDVLDKVPTSWATRGDVAAVCLGIVLGALLAPFVLPTAVVASFGAATAYGGVYLLGSALGAITALGSKLTLDYAIPAAVDAVKSLVKKRLLSETRRNRIESLRDILKKYDKTELSLQLDLMVDLWEAGCLENEKLEQGLTRIAEIAAGLKKGGSSKLPWG